MVLIKLELVLDIDTKDKLKRGTKAIAFDLITNTIERPGVKIVSYKDALINKEDLKKITGSDNPNTEHTIIGSLEE